VKGTDAWSIGEVVHALVVMAITFSVAGIICGCGINPEIDQTTINNNNNNKNDNNDNTSEKQEKEEVDKVSMSKETAKLVTILKAGTVVVEEGEIFNRELFERVEPPLNENPNVQKNNKQNEKLKKMVGKYTMKYVDFDVKSSQYSIFRVQDYSWKEHGYSLMSRYYADAAQLVDEEFDCIYALTYNHVSSHTNVDTSPLRQAIWYYVQRLYGICNDQYNYRAVYTYLNKDFKLFLKKLTSYPDTVSKEDFAQMGIDLLPEEKCHVVLLAVEAAKQSHLLYGLFAVMKFML